VSVEAPSLPTGSSDSTTLVGRLKLRDAQAWQRFSDLYGPLVYSWARRAGLQDSDAADVTQDVFRAVAEGVAQFRKNSPSDTFRGWLWGIARHKILSEFRRRASKPDLADALLLQQLAAHLPEQPADNLDEELAALARRAMALLRTDFQAVTWQAFEQTVLHSRAAADVAADLGISVGSVYTAKCRVLARLRQELGDLL
jgi:RNA polymerase sigma-70 factor (ECF subfamily)